MNLIVSALIFLLKLSTTLGCPSQANVKPRGAICGNVQRSDLNPKLLQYADNGDVQMIACLLEFGADVNAKSLDGYTALIKASINGNTELLEFLIESGADINATTKHGFTALLYAAKRGHFSAAELLVYKGADVNAKDNFERTSLMHLVRNGYIDLVKSLIIEAKEKELSPTALSFAIEESKQNIVQAVDFFINHGADINAKTSQGQTALTYTSRDGFIETVKKLVENGADVNATTSFGVTSLMLASSQFGHFKVTDTLVDNGIDTRESKFHALLKEVQQSHVKIANVLINYGADINVQNKMGVSALTISTISPIFPNFHFLNGQTEIVKDLILHGANINSTLEWAKNNDRYEEVKSILIANSDI